ncbi:MAG: terminase small subunit [Clostridia bacterium]|nr:terminase small subunit [Clostridia bacterium]MCI2014052.1 terminase small subunit [Clostridia bacterium]
MTEKQKRFADEYIIDLNATRAYKAAYPSVKKDEAAAACASKLLRNTKVKKYVDEQLKKINDRKIAKAQEVMQYLSKVMRGEEKEEVPILCGDGCQELVKKDIGAKDRIKAAELLGKRYNLFTDNVKLEGTAAVQIIDDIGGTDNAETK